MTGSKIVEGLEEALTWSGQVTVGRTLQRTMELRQLVWPGSMPRLQQAWRNVETGEIEWQDVPCVLDGEVA